MFTEILPGPSNDHSSECHFLEEKISSVNTGDNQYQCLLLGDLNHDR